MKIKVLFTKLLLPVATDETHSLTQKYITPLTVTIALFQIIFASDFINVGILSYMILLNSHSKYM